MYAYTCTGGWRQSPYEQEDIPTNLMCMHLGYSCGKCGQMGRTLSCLFLKMTKWLAGMYVYIYIYTTLYIHMYIHTTRTHKHVSFVHRENGQLVYLQDIHVYMCLHQSFMPIS
jgi:hypothetical protein